MRRFGSSKNWWILFAVAVIAVSFVATAYVSACPKEGEQGPGYNKALPLVSVPEGYPPLPSVARYLGELKGSWIDIGKQYGTRAGDLIVLVFDGWYGEEVSKKMSWSEIYITQ
jgi:hypothetical protein